jgi:hypothetical protein
MGIKRTRDASRPHFVALGLAVALVVTLPAAFADAQGPAPLWKGWSAHGRSKAWISPEFKVLRLRFGWRARCTGGRHVYTTTTNFIRVPNGPLRPDHTYRGSDAVRRAFHDRGSYRERAGRGVTSTIRIRVRGVLKHDPLNAHADGVYGRFRVRLAVRRGRRVVDRCRVRNGRFEAYTP